MDDSVSELATVQYVDDSVRASEAISAAREYVDEKAGECVNKSGDQMTGNFNMGNNNITQLGDPVRPSDAVHKSYVDNKIRSFSFCTNTAVRLYKFHTRHM